MAKTPYIRPIAVQGGTFYTFSSAAEDLSLTFNNSLKKFSFSKYALLKLPEFGSPTYGENTLQFNAIDTTFLDAAEGDFILTNPNNLSPSPEISFQNYCLNLESTVISDPNYNPDLKRNVSERVFWKWVKELGGVRYRAANNNEVVASLNQTTTTTKDGFPYSDKRWVEEDTFLTGNGSPTPRYERIVQYVGDIDVVNSVQNSENAYSEVYIHVPTGDGGTPYVLFKTVADENYYPDRTWTHLPADPTDTEYLQGRDSASGLYGPNGLPKLAIFDQDVLGDPGVSGASATGSFSNNWYSPRDEANSYFTDPSFFDNTNYTLEKYLAASGPTGYTVTYKRSNLDGVQIDFDPASYKAIQNYVGISTIEEWNGTPVTTSFEFNAVLVYYDVYDPNNPTDSETNLYGILFLNDPEPVSTNAAKLPTFKKFKPDPITKLNGNSYGFKINLKFDTDVESTGVEQAINDYSSFSLSIFMDAATVLQDAAKNLNDRTLQIINMQQDINDLKDLIINTDDSNEIKARLDVVEASLQANQALFDNTQDILSLIEQNTDSIQNILQNQTSINMSYNLDLLKDGNGTSVNRNTPNILKVDVTQQDYNIGNSSLFTINPVSGNTVPLSLYTNYLKHKNNGVSITATNDIVIRIDDSLNKWQKGQVIRFVIGDEIDLGNYSIVILTDALGEYPKTNPSGVPYSVVVAGFLNVQFSSSGYKPIFDIVCVDEKNLIFEIDQIR
jgi:hypothetical protein